MDSTTSSNPRVASLRKKHAEFDVQIREEEARPLPDILKVTDLKRRKLAVKEELDALGETGGKRKRLKKAA